MKITIEIDATHKDLNPYDEYTSAEDRNYEIWNALTEWSGRALNGNLRGPIRSSNGNVIGRAHVEAE